MSIVYEMLSVFPLEESVKLSFHVSRKVALLVAKAIEMGIAHRDEQPGLFGIADDGTMNELKGIPEEIMTKAGLMSLNQKLTALSAK